MKKIVLILVLFITSTTLLYAQNLTGQWKGSFIDKSESFMGFGSSSCEYVLELETEGNTVKGFSYTYFNEGGKRFYTICRLTGFIKKGSKYVEVTEVERTKTNVPENVRNCFQIHKLTFFKAGNEETLEGNWIPAPKQEGDCGYGVTTLTRRVLVTANKKPLFNNATTRADKPKTIITPKPLPKPKPKPAEPIVKQTKPIVKPKNTDVAKAEKDKTIIAPKPQEQKPIIKPLPIEGFEKRNNDVIQTIEIKNETFKVDFYDNGDVDGDSISVFYNGKLVLTHQRLSEKALSLTLDIDPKIATNELIMYADNLGSIPPNTAVMIVTDGDKRYEVRIASDLKKSGTIRFIHK